MKEQSTMEDRLQKWIESQHGTAGWEMKLENFIKQELNKAKQEAYNKGVQDGLNQALMLLQGLLTATILALIILWHRRF